MQSWRPAKFTLDREAINYRRFFAISDLAGVRVEDPEVFEATHALILALVEEGLVDGLRVDHIDGLRDPKAYLQRLGSVRRGSAISWSRRSSRPTSACPPTGTSTAPPATRSPICWPGS